MGSKLTVRDYFAGMALMGLVQEMGHYDESLRQWVAIKSYEIADNMLKVRDK